MRPSSSASGSGWAPARRKSIRRRPRLSWRTVLTAALVLAVGAAALAIPQSLYALTSVQVPAAAVALAPETLGEEVAWQRVIRHDDPDAITGVSAGAAGPIVVTNHGAWGLDPATGEPTWSYTRPASLLRIGNPCDATTGLDGPLDPYTDASCYAVVSPDRGSLVLGYDAGALGTLLVVVDTTSGEVAFERMAYGGDEDSRGARKHSDVHVTDHVLMVGEEVLSLESGRRLATVPENATPAPYDYSNRYLSYDCPNDVAWCWEHKGPSTGGHATVILGLTCWRPDQDFDKHSNWCEARIVPDDDPTAVRVVEGIVGPGNGGPEVIDGWAVRYADPDAAYATLAQSSLEDTDPADQAAARDLSLEAVDLDSVSDPEPEEAMPLNGIGGAVHAYRTQHPYRVLTVEGMPKEAERSAEDAEPEVYVVPSAGGAYTAAELARLSSGAAYLETLNVHRSKNEGVSAVGPDGEAVLQLEDYPAADNQFPTSGAGYILRAPGVVAVVDHHMILDEATGNVSYELIITGLR
ncbi:hypothetical protein [Actinomyces sp. MRS3W]|uniref:hypothetical protein n=1 Tax=Actinomyces sp. MRS3W TaxID=2800796 RepID=UPI0028FD7617|nr:hypothetical protein [Actinomyces sp. MRS3W]MDU0347958.1 hypothetical protein [Actinomyces sp. MRS3W]